MTAPVISNRYALDGIITTVDAVNAENELNKHKESVKQIAVADRIVITKSDLVQLTELKSLKARLKQLNPGSPKELAIMGEIAPDKLFDAGLYDPKTKSMDVQRWLRDEDYTKSSDEHDHHHNVNRHDDAITAFCMTREKPIDWEAFVAWIRILIGQHGERLLRIKGILNIAGREKPIAIHGVQHMFHDPAELSNWPDDDRRSRLVFITHDLDRSIIEEKLDSLTEQAASLE